MTRKYKKNYNCRTYLCQFRHINRIPKPHFNKKETNNKTQVSYSQQSSTIVCHHYNNKKMCPYGPIAENKECLKDYACEAYYVNLGTVREGMVKKQVLKPTLPSLIKSTQCGCCIWKHILYSTPCNPIHQQVRQAQFTWQCKYWTRRDHKFGTRNNFGWNW